MAEVVRPFLVTAMAHLMAVSALIGMTGREATDPAEIRQALEEQGARAVKVEPVAKVEEAKNRMGLKLDMTFQQMAIKYVEGSDTGLDEKRLIKIGKELMEE